MGDYNDDDEYTTARKLVIRASRREAALSSSDQTLSGGSGDSNIGADFSKLPLKADHIQRPCWTCPDGLIYLEAFHDLYNQAYDFLVAIAEPVARPEFLHQYKVSTIRYLTLCRLSLSLRSSCSCAFLSKYNNWLTLICLLCLTYVWYLIYIVNTLQFVRGRRDEYRNRIHHRRSRTSFQKCLAQTGQEIHSRLHHKVWESEISLEA